MHPDHEGLGTASIEGLGTAPQPSPPSPPSPPARVRRRRRRRRRRRALLATALAGVLAAGCLVGVAYARTPLPTKPQDGVTDQGSVVYYADGTTPILRLGANREVVGHTRIPDHLRWAVLAAEDRGFHKEHGVSPKGMVRALWSTASGRQVQGGSTITQQLARNYFRGLDKTRSIDRKLREVLVSVKLDRHRSKDEILDLYLNTVYFGRQASGVQAAAHAFFHKDVWQLTVAESALLAAMIQRPAYFRTQGDDPPARALRARWKYVIDGMVATGRLDRAQAGRLTFPHTRREWVPADPTGQSSLVRQRVQEELTRLGIPAEQVFRGGLKIYTALDRRWMEAAARAVRDAGEERWHPALRGGLIALDPESGAIKAFYGGDPERSQYDSVFNPIAQAGSTFKPYALAAALRQGYSVRSMVDGSSPLRFAPDGSVTPLNTPGYLVDNDEKTGSVGPVDLVRAMALSVNTGFVKLGLEVGIGNVAASARALGVPSKSLAPYTRQAGLVLGVPTVSAVTQAAGYAAFANGGTPVTPHLITRIVDSRGRTIAAPGGRARRAALSTEQAAQVTHTLRQAVVEGTGHRAALPGREVAGKTGTTDGNRAAWFVGYVPQVSAAVVMANTRPGPLTTGARGTRTAAAGTHAATGTGAAASGTGGRGEVIDGGTVPAEIWRAFMAEVTASMPAASFREAGFAGRVADWTANSQGGGPPGGGPPPCAPGDPRRVCVERPAGPGRTGDPGGSSTPTARTKPTKPTGSDKPRGPAAQPAPPTPSAPPAPKR